MASKKRSANGVVSKTLSLATLPENQNQHVVVEVPEFGMDENGRPYTVNVLPMNVKMKQVLTKRVNHFVRGEDGKFRPIPRADVSEVCIIAAMCARDDNNNYVFGATLDDAIALVESLPQDYTPAIVRISSTALGNVAGLPPATAVEEAEKNS